jgi:hypothetical protein
MPKNKFIEEAESLAERRKSNELTRRGFLKFLAGAAISVAGVAGKENNAEAGVGIRRESECSTENQETSRTIEVIPEYERNLDKIMIAVRTPDKVKGDKKQSFTGKEFVRIYGGILLALPEYSKIELLVNEKSRHEIADAVFVFDTENGTNILERVYWRIVPDVVNIDQWTQDYGEAIKINGKEKFLVPMNLDPDKFFSKDVARNIERKRSYHSAFEKDGLEQADFYFDGGNMTFDRTKNGLRVFIGYNDVYYTIQNYLARGQVITEDDVALKISKQFGGAEVAIMGDKEQKNICYHIDQSFIVLSDQIAVINECIDKPNVPAAKQLSLHKNQLEKLGYTPITIPCRYVELENSYYSTNAIPFSDKKTGERKIIFPVFPEETAIDLADKTSALISENNLTGKALLAFKAYKQAGYKPIPIRDFAFNDLGNIHCLTNVLAMLPKEKNIPA